MNEVQENVFEGAVGLLRRRKRLKTDESVQKLNLSNYDSLPLTARIPKDSSVSAKFQYPFNFGSQPSHEHLLNWHNFGNDLDFLSTFAECIENFDSFSAFSSCDLKEDGNSSDDIDSFIKSLLSHGLPSIIVEQRLLKVNLTSNNKMVVLLNSEFRCSETTSLVDSEKNVYVYICSSTNLRNSYFTFLFLNALGHGDYRLPVYQNEANEISILKEQVKFFKTQSSHFENLVQSNREHFESSSLMTLTQSYMNLKDSFVNLLASVKIAKGNPNMLKLSPRFESAYETLLDAEKKMLKNPLDDYGWFKKKDSASSCSDAEWILPALSKIIAVLSRLMVCLTRDETDEGDPHHMAKKLGLFENVFQKPIVE